MTAPFDGHPESGTAPASGGRVRGYGAARKALAVIIGVAAAAIIAVAVAVAVGVVGRGGGDYAEGSGGWADMQHFILADSTNIVMILNVAAILGFEEFPQIADDMGWGNGYFDDPEQWKHEYVGGLISSLEYDLGQFVDGITRLVAQIDDDGRSDLDVRVAMGDFRFDAMRDSLNGRFREADTYHGFEVWDNRNVALLENRGAIILGDGTSRDELVTGILRSQVTGKGTIAGVTKDSEQGWELKRALERAGDGIFTFAVVECADLGNDYIVDSLHSCDAFVGVVKDSGSDFVEIKAALVFSRASRAEAFMKYMDESDADLDIDIASIETDGRFISVEFNLNVASLADILDF